jgi:hypothetical protein
MGCVLPYDDRGRLRPDAWLLVYRLALVVVEFGSRSKWMAARQRARGILYGVLAGELALHVTGHVFGVWWWVVASDWQSARHHGRSCLSGELRETVAANLAAEAALDRLGAVDNLAPVAGASLRQTSRPH